ncbi:uncharacterized protein LOC108741567 [Agrilus planipennis]|uniref:Uncharacterized protein LOC108741567 n=1 Tax=Agrilus planipennis TaxID=224129 RepID=A0A1W4XGK2_AGRPL|nr:uncharacterized protein LOC108741567 [Agrilus planipennis]
MLRRSILLQVCLLSVIVTSRCQEQNSEQNAENEEIFGYVDNSDHSRIRSLDGDDDDSPAKNSPIDYSGYFASGGSFGASDKGNLNVPLPKALAPSYAFGQASEAKDLLSEAPYKALDEQSDDEDKAFTKEDIIDKEAVKLDDTPYDYKSSSLTNLPSFDTSISNKEAVPSGKLSYSPLGASDYSSFDDFNYQPSSSSYNPSPSSYIPSRYFGYIPKSAHDEAHASETQPQKESRDGCVDVDKKIDDRMMRCSVCTDAKGGQSENCAYAAQPKTYYNEKHYSSKAPENIRQKRSRKSVIEDPYEYIRSRNAYKSRPKEFDYSYYNSKEDEEESKESKDSYNYDFNPNDYVFEKSTSEKEGEKMVKEGKNCQQSTKDGMTCTVCVNPEGGNFEQCSYAVEPKEKKYAYVKESKFDGNGKPVVKERLATTDGQNPHTQAATKQIVTNQPAPTEQQKPAQTASAGFQMRNVPSPFVKQQPQPAAAAPQPALLLRSAPASPTIAGAATAPVPSMVAMASDPDAESIIDQEHKALVGRGKGKDFDDTKDEHPYEAYESATDEEAVSAEELDDEDVSTAVSKEKTRSDDDEYHFNFGDVYKPDAQTIEKSVAPAKGQPGDYFHTDESKKDVEKVFAEFIKKDRSNCKQVAKKGMTCYLCLDSKGIQNEECMYVSESQPKNTLMAYHEMQHTNQKPGVVPAPTVESKAEVQMMPQSTAATAVQQQQQQPQAAASSLVETVIKYVPTPASETKPIPIKRSIERKSKTPKKYHSDVAAAASEKDEEEAEESEERDDDERMDSSEKDDPEVEERQKLKKNPNDPEPQFDMHDEEGLFKEETRPVYSKALGYSLPRFMLERSEHEESYDEFVRGRNKNRD